MTTDGDRDLRADLVVRRDLYRRFGPAQLALSADGSEIIISAPVEAGLHVGSFAVVEDAGDPGDLVVQVRSLSLVDRLGPELRVDVDVDVDVEVSDAQARETSASVRTLIRAVDGAAAVVGSIGPDGFHARNRVAAFGERFVRPAEPEEVRVLVDALTAGQPSIPIGEHQEAPGVTASLVAKGFSRHTFLCGQSGSGKTYTTGVIFERLLAGTSLPLVVLDPNSDHVHLGAVAPDADDSPEVQQFAAVAPTVRVARARGSGGDLVLCADFSDLGLDAQALLLRLRPIEDADEFAVLRRITDAMPPPYSLDDVITAASAATPIEPLAGRLVTRIRNLGVADWDVWRREGEASIAGANLPDERCVVFDLGSLGRPEERSAVALAVLGARWRRRRERRPVLIAIDEAHNVLPSHTEDTLLQAITDLGVLIAGEGRKFGLHLFVATQRPSKVHPNIVSQCDNLLLMRMNGARDVGDLVGLFSHVPEAMMRSAIGFGLGQALVAGPISPVPSIVQVGRRLSPEGGGDVPTTWARLPAGASDEA